MYPNDYLRKLSESLSRLDISPLPDLADVLYYCKGCIVFSGVGKSGIVAMKASATLASVGCRSQFVHPTDLLHGSLGGLRNTDLMILVSNSGETPEILEVARHSVNRVNAIFSVTASTQSTLAKLSDSCLLIGECQEILSGVPSASCIVSLALFDILAFHIVNKFQTNPKQNHPGGHK